MSNKDRSVWTASAELTIEKWARENLFAPVVPPPPKMTKDESRRLLDFATVHMAHPWPDPIPYQPPNPRTPFTIPRAERPNLEEVISEVEYVPTSIWGTTSDKTFTYDEPLLTEDMMRAAIEKIRGKRRKPSARPEPAHTEPLALHPPKPRKILV